MLFPNFTLALDHRGSCENKSSQCIETGQLNFALSIGIGLRTNPLFESDDIPLIILPEISYYSDNFFIENLDIGYTLVDTPTTSFSLIATPSFDSLFFSRWDPGNILVDLSSYTQEAPITVTDSVEDNQTQINPDEVFDRKFTYLAGVEYSTEFENSQLQLSLLSDITKTHYGKEIRFAYAYKFSQTFSTTLGFTWKDEKLTDYYYGLSPNEVVDDRGVYQASASFNPFIRFSFNTQINNDNNWRLSLEYQKLSNQISNSPIVDDNYVVTFFVGKKFRFK